MAAAAVCFAVPSLAVHQCKKSFGFYKTSRVCSACMFCWRLSASLPSGKRENASATDLPVLLALVKPFLLCICPWSAPLPAAAPQQHTHRVLRVPAASRVLPYPAHSPCARDVCSPVGWLCLSAGSRCGLCPAFPRETGESVSLFSYRLLLLTEPAGLSCTRPRLPLTNWAGISELAQAVPMFLMR